MYGGMLKVTEDMKSMIKAFHADLRSLIQECAHTPRRKKKNNSKFKKSMFSLIKILDPRISLV